MDHLPKAGTFAAAGLWDLASYINPIQSQVHHQGMTSLSHRPAASWLSANRTPSLAKDDWLQMRRGSPARRAQPARDRSTPFGRYQPDHPNQLVSRRCIGPRYQSIFAGFPEKPGDDAAGADVDIVQGSAWQLSKPRPQLSYGGIMITRELPKLSQCIMSLSEGPFSLCAKKCINICLDKIEKFAEGLDKRHVRLRQAIF
jgi:hypothetical protein